MLLSRLIRALFGLLRALAFQSGRPLVRLAPGTGPMPGVPSKNFSYGVCLAIENLLVVQNRAETEVREPLCWFGSKPAVFSEQ